MSHQPSDIYAAFEIASNDVLMLVLSWMLTSEQSPLAEYQTNDNLKAVSTLFLRLYDDDVPSSDEWKVAEDQVARFFSTYTGVDAIEELMDLATRGPSSLTSWARELGGVSTQSHAEGILNWAVKPAKGFYKKGTKFPPWFTAAVASDFAIGMIYFSAVKAARDVDKVRAKETAIHALITVPLFHMLHTWFLTVTEKTPQWLLRTANSNTPIFSKVADRIVEKVSERNARTAFMDTWTLIHSLLIRLNS